jgi:Capsule assembly protein Wzi
MRSAKRNDIILIRSIIFLLAAGVSLLPFQLQAQMLIVGSSEEDSLRMAQLSDSNKTLLSMVVRPVQLRPIVISWKKVQVTALPFTLITQYNSHHPFGWNDGAMIPAKGVQTFVRAGVYMRYGIMEVQLAPEWIYAANSRYDTSVNWGSNAGGVYNKVFPGQSAACIRFGSVSMGVSTQNLWWGPGMRSSLLMSNNAPGFLHAYIRSNRPAKTPIGNFEWQLIGSRLDSDSTRPYENRNLKLTTESYPATWRYQSAFVISYQPKWIPGLFVGMTRTLQRYQKDIGLGGSGFLKKYVPVLTKAFQKKNEQNDDAENTDQLASFFFRWVMPKSGWEFYGEWGYNDYNQNVRDYVMDATHSAAYILGVSKIYNFGKRSVWVGLETLKQSETPSALLRGAGNWYVHGGDNGYTNQNQIIGSGVGYGSDLQTFRLFYTRKDKPHTLLMQMERIQREPTSSLVKWTDFSWLIQPGWQFKQIRLSTSLNCIFTQNFLWQENKQVVNIQFRLMFSYFFIP